MTDAISRILDVWTTVRKQIVVVAAVFALGSVFSVLGRTAEGRSSLFGPVLFVVWMLVVFACLGRRRAG